MTCLSSLKYHSKICQAKNQDKIVEFGQFKTNSKQKVLKNHEKNEIKVLACNFVASSHLPFNVLEDKHLKNLCQKMIELGAKHGNLALDQVWYGRHTISEYIFERVQEFKDQLKPVISECLANKTIVGSTDIWTDSVLRLSYIDVTVHFLVNSLQKTA